ncbi:glycoside hydrolase [Neoconidiobolus thromboides FSU 785]|nr:glycoside hydrolase [Neoconidiobolus thromboides FSU 785]
MVKLNTLALMLVGWLSGTALAKNLPPRVARRDVGQGISGFTYSPYLESGCKSSAQVANELKRVSELTSNIRLYSTDCDQLSNAINAITSQGLNLKILAGVWTRDGEGKRNDDIAKISGYASKNEYKSLFTGISVGNEELMNGRNIGSVISNIEAAKAQLSGLGIPIGYAETAANLKSHPELNDVCDKIYANIYSFFSPRGDGDMGNAAESIIIQYNDLSKQFPDKVVISEVGWSTRGQGNYLADPSEENQANFLQSLICKASKSNIPYYILEPYDSKWKSRGDDDSVEIHFGVMNDNGSFKFAGFNPNPQC